MLHKPFMIWTIFYSSFFTCKYIMSVMKGVLTRQPSRSIKLSTCLEWRTSQRAAPLGHPPEWSCNSVRAYRITLHKFTCSHKLSWMQKYMHTNSLCSYSLPHRLTPTQTTPSASPILLPSLWTDTQRAAECFKYSSEVICLRCLCVAMADLSSTAVTLSLLGSASDLFMKCDFSLPAGELKLLAG